MPWHRFVTPLAIVIAGVLAAADASAAPFGSAFTYQGEIRDAGEAPTGAYDLRFRAYPAVDDAGVPLAEVVVEDVPVVEGIFTARVDFGSKFFVGDAVFVELAVRPGVSADPGAFEALAPRQELTAAPYALKTAAGSVTDIELADGAIVARHIGDGVVESRILASNAVAGANVADGTLAPNDLDLASFNPVFWRVGGNAGIGGSVLGTTDNTRLALQSGVGVTINGPAVNNNTELTIRGNAQPVEGNADLTLWPRGGEAFFNISTFGTTDADTRFAIHSVDTVPSFTGFATRLAMTHTGQLGVGNFASLTPLARIHSVRSGLGLDATDLPNSYELVLEDNDAQLGLYSGPGAGIGSAIGFAELDAAGGFTDQWGLYREAVASGSSLQLAYGTNIAVASNPPLIHFGTNASLGVGLEPPTTGTEVFVAGTSTIPGGTADLSLQPQGGNSLFNFSAGGAAQADAQLVLQFNGPNFAYEPRVRFDNNGSVGFGRLADPSPFADSFVFADDSSGAVFGPSATNQFLVRANNGAALNGDPVQSTYELSVLGRAPGESAEIAMSQVGGDVGLVLSVDGQGQTDTRFRILERDASGSGVALTSRMWIAGNGFVGFNGPFGNPGAPLIVGNGGQANGNGAFLSTGGVWTNASSRSLKEAFTAIDVEDVLERVLALSVTRWRYRGVEGSWHLGPVAEEFMSAFGLGDNERYIGSVDADGVALAAIQGLAQRDGERIAALERENAALRGNLDALSARLEALERAGARQ